MYVEVFLSYSRKDKEFADQIVKKFDKKGIQVWLDEKIPPGEDLSEEIKEAIQSAQCFLVLWSKSSVNKGTWWVKDETHFALKKNIKIVQLKLDESDIPIIRLEENLYIPLEICNNQITEASLNEVTEAVKNTIGLQGPNEHIVRPKVDGKDWKFDDLAIENPVPGTGIFVSFRPCGEDGVFLLTRFETTDGWVKSDIPSAEKRHKPYESEHSSTYKDEKGNKFLKVKNDIFFIRDPLRPYGVQIGGLRSKRPSANPGMISGNIPPEQLDALPTKLEWVSMTLAEILSTPESLQYLWHDIDKQSWTEDSKQKIKQLISKNPNAPQGIQKKMCLFCNKTFKQKRRISLEDMEKKHGAYIVANDFPFGPAFHYLVITEEQVHSWENLNYHQIQGLNLIIHDFLKDENNRKGAAGVSFGFNSTIRHLILGKHTQSSAGASISHVHKQAWGMIQGTPNLAEQLIQVGQAYWNYHIDYQGAYIEALRKFKYVIWEDKNVILYVPYGQCSKSELQAMVLRESTGCFTDLTVEEVVSLSQAEYIALRLFKSLEINSFNHVILSKLYNDTRYPKFRLVEAFITREVDLAVSELSMLFVIDQHPWDSRNEIWEKWDTIEIEVCKEIGVNPRLRPQSSKE